MPLTCRAKVALGSGFDRTVPSEIEFLLIMKKEANYAIYVIFNFSLVLWRSPVWRVATRQKTIDIARVSLRSSVYQCDRPVRLVGITIKGRKNTFTFKLIADDFLRAGNGPTGPMTLEDVVDWKVVVDRYLTVQGLAAGKGGTNDKGNDGQGNDSNNMEEDKVTA